MRALWILFALLISQSAMASVPSTQRSNVQKDRDAIKALAGCYEVSFNFAETFSFEPGYQFAPRYETLALETIIVDEETPDSIKLQHILTTPAGPQKHWRQEWQYEGDTVLTYRGNQTWEKTQISANDAQGRWVQRVFQVDDSPRYECSAPWVQWGSERYWECRTWSPLPRRDSTKRSDYHVMDRRNRQQLTVDGWRHEEDNIKLRQSANGAFTPLVKEKGENIYRKLDDSECADAANWWKTNGAAWHAIQSAWKRVYASNKRIQLADEVGGEPLFAKLFKLGDKATKAKMSAEETEREALTIIAAYFR